MHTLSSIDPYYLAGIFDKALSLNMRCDKRVFKVISKMSGTPSLLHFAQSLFGGKVRSSRGSGVLTLYQTETYALSLHLIDIPSRNQECYRLIVELKKLRDEYVASKGSDLDTFRVKRDALIHQLKTAYHSRQMPTTIPLDKIELYKTGVVEASRWLSAANRRGPFGGRIQLEKTSPFHPILGFHRLVGKNLQTFIKTHSQYMTFRKPVFLELLACELAKDGSSNGKTLLDRYNTFESRHESSFQLSQSLSVEEYAQKITSDRIRREEERQACKTAQKLAKAAARLRQMETRKQQSLERAARRRAEKERKQSEHKQAQETKRQARRALLELESSLLTEGRMRCRKCESVKSLDDFNRASHTHTGYSLYCKKCCHKEHYLAKRDERLAKSREWQRNNKERMRALSKKEKSKPHNRIRHHVKRRVNEILDAKGASRLRYRDLISCSPQDFINHITSQFAPEMSWDNYGPYWHLDHIIPCAAFDITKPNHLKWCWHHKNLQPLKGEDNVTKRDSLPGGYFASELRSTNPALLHEIVSQELEKQGITTALEYMESLKSDVSVQYIDLS